jgi:prevent-host-death family protein
MARQYHARQRTARAAPDRRSDDGAALSVPAAQFKAHCLSLLERVRQSRRPIVVTKHGRPVAKVVPLRSESPSILGFSKGTAKILGDLVAPTGERWEADAK